MYSSLEFVRRTKGDQIEAVRPHYERWQRYAERGCQGSDDAAYNAAQSGFYAAVEAVGITVQQAEAILSAPASVSA